MSVNFRALLLDLWCGSKHKKSPPGAPWGTFGDESDGGLGKCRGLEKLVCKLEWLVGFRDVRLFVFPQPVAKE